MIYYKGQTSKAAELSEDIGQNVGQPSQQLPPSLQLFQPKIPFEQQLNHQKKQQKYQNQQQTNAETNHKNNIQNPLNSRTKLLQRIPLIKQDLQKVNQNRKLLQHHQLLQQQQIIKYNLNLQHLQPHTEIQKELSSESIPNQNIENPQHLFSHKYSPHQKIKQRQTFNLTSNKQPSIFQQNLFQQRTNQSHLNLNSQPLLQQNQKLNVLQHQKNNQLENQKLKQQYQEYLSLQNNQLKYQNLKQFKTEIPQHQQYLQQTQLHQSQQQSLQHLQQHQTQPHLQPQQQLQQQHQFSRIETQYDVSPKHTQLIPNQSLHRHYRINNPHDNYFVSLPINSLQNHQKQNQQQQHNKNTKNFQDGQFNQQNTQQQYTQNYQSPYQNTEHQQNPNHQQSPHHHQQNLSKAQLFLTPTIPANSDNDNHHDHHANVTVSPGDRVWLKCGINNLSATNVTTVSPYA